MPSQVQHQHQQEEFLAPEGADEDSYFEIDDDTEEGWAALNECEDWVLP